ncbi:Maf family protein [Corynebacterium comes]|uniref:Nucleoside triphosphate pyrophosphatase n=1 Tax=Corynebacterium comes TaxID=2675218 RepID=A0A6B8VXZ8_9CORY|nr:nucleoside triphosphate pyrophosphatase [Corynebacterium comes]QGU03885.1 Maf-like protein YceF [Corynebacterium comes]
MRIVLASASPSRRMILTNAGVDPLIRPADVDEDALLASLSHATPARRVAALAEAKALSVAGEFPDDVVIGGDSMLLLDGRLQGKPHTPEKTVERWGEQAGKAAELLTGHCVILGDRKVVETTSTTVHFADASEADIAAYARSGEPLQCAGAFTLEALGGWFIDRIEGDPSSVIGLSLPLVRRALYSFGLDASHFWTR